MRTQYEMKPAFVGLFTDAVIDPNNYIAEAIGPFRTFAALEKACNELEEDERKRRNDPTFTLQCTVTMLSMPEGTRYAEVS